MKTLLTATAISALLIGSAFGADLGPSFKDEQLSAYAAKSWSGIWAGALIGAEFSNNALSYAYDTVGKGYHEGYNTHTSLDIDGLGTTGAFGELQLGYDRQIGQNLVLGVFGGLNINSGDFSASLNASDSEGSSGKAELTFSQKWGGVIGPRLGYAHGNSLFYVAGGWAFGEMDKIKGSISANGESASAALLPDQETSLSGYFAEVGLEHRLSESLSVKVSGRYTDYGALDLYKDSGSTPCHDWNDKLELDRDTLSAMVGITYRP